MANYYIHIPRTGGHSLTSSLPWGNYTYLGHNLRDPAYRHPREVCTAGDFVFTVMRDPFERLVSAFNFLHRGGWCAEDNDDAYRLGIRTLAFARSSGPPCAPLPPGRSTSSPSRSTSTGFRRCRSSTSPARPRSFPR